MAIYVGTSTHVHSTFGGTLGRKPSTPEKSTWGFYTMATSGVSRLKPAVKEQLLTPVKLTALLEYYTGVSLISLAGHGRLLALCWPCCRYAVSRPDGHTLNLSVLIRLSHQQPWEHIEFILYGSAVIEPKVGSIMFQLLNRKSWKVT